MNEYSNIQYIFSFNYISSIKVNENELKYEIHNRR